MIRKAESKDLYTLSELACQLWPDHTVEEMRSEFADIYSHVTDTMQKQAAVKIDHQIGKTDAPMPPDEQKKHTDQSGFQPYKSKYRKAGTGGIYQLNDHLWEGQYSPRDAHGKRISRNVYAKTKEECEEKLAVMIEDVKREIAVEKDKLRQRAT